MPFTSTGRYEYSDWFREEFRRQICSVGFLNFTLIEQIDVSNPRDAPLITKAWRVDLRSGYHSVFDKLMKMARERNTGFVFLRRADSKSITDDQPGELDLKTYKMNFTFDFHHFILLLFL